MSVYLVADINVKDPSWVPAYAARVHEIVHQHGGRYLARSGKNQAIEGPDGEQDLTALIVFPSKHAAKAFLSDPDYAPFMVARQRGSDSRLRLVEGIDSAGTIDYLPKG